MVGVAQSVEHQVVALVVAGSSPVAHPKQKAVTVVDIVRMPLGIFIRRNPSLSPLV
jgi:hypothetical protein